MSKTNLKAVVSAAQTLLAWNANLVRARVRSGMTQHDVASAIGAREEHIEDLEAGRTIPTTRELLLLGYVLDVPVSELLGDADR